MGSEVRVLGINASPRKYGNTYKALLIALKGAEKEGASVKVIHLYDLDIKPCAGCVSDDIRLCRYPCPIDDDMRNVYEEVLRSDALIIATPIYWFNVSAPLKAFIDRLTVFENMIYIDGRSWVEGKVAGFIAIGNDSGAIAVIQNLMAVFNSMGFVIPPWSLAYYTGSEDITKVENLIMDALNVGRISVIMVKVLRGLMKAPETWYRADEEYKEFARNVAAQVDSHVNKEVLGF